jgi:hypothetical protein
MGGRPIVERGELKEVMNSHNGKQERSFSLISPAPKRYSPLSFEDSFGPTSDFIKESEVVHDDLASFAEAEEELRSIFSSLSRTSSTSTDYSFKSMDDN